MKTKNKLDLLSKACAKTDIRPELASVYITSNTMVATNSYLLLECSNDTNLATGYYSNDKRLASYVSADTYQYPDYAKIVPEYSQINTIEMSRDKVQRYTDILPTKYSDASAKCYIQRIIGNDIDIIYSISKGSISPDLLRLAFEFLLSNTKCNTITIQFTDSKPLLLRCGAHMALLMPIKE